MKILMLGWELPPYNTGGLGVACYQLCKALAIRGVEIDFVVPYQDAHEGLDFMRIIPALPHSHAELAAAGGAYSSAGFGNYEEQSADDGVPAGLRSQQRRYTKAIKNIVKNGEYDAIHAHDWLTFEAAMAAKGHLNKPLIAHVHATEFDRAGAESGNPIVHEIEYATLCMADRIIAVSQGTKDLLAKRYAIPADKIDVMHNSIDPTSLAPASDANVYAYLNEMKGHGYKVVVNLGRLTIQKGLTHLLRAAQLVVEKNPKVLFLLAGTGDQYHELIGLVAELGISQNVLFTGQFVSGAAWRDAYAVGDMFVLPSVSEPFGITPLEAIGYGTPALISKQSGVGEVVRNVLKFDYWDTEKLANQILAIAEHGALYESLRDNALEEFKNLSWHTVAQKCQGIYEQTLASREEVLV